MSFFLYEKKFETAIVDNSTNINKTNNHRSYLKPLNTNNTTTYGIVLLLRVWKESLNSDGQQSHQYQQNKRKFKQWWSTIPPVSTKQKKV